MTLPRLVRSAETPAKGLAERSDDELMQLAQAGLREAFAVLVERHALSVVQTCARFTNDFSIGVELAQETWVALWEQRARYRPESDFTLWLVSAARNRCRNHARHRRVVERHALREIALDTPAEPDQIDRLLAEERARKLRAALARVPLALREALLLRYAEELRYDEMARVVDAGESTLRSRVHHGLKLLRSLLEKQNE